MIVSTSGATAVITQDMRRTRSPVTGVYALALSPDLALTEDLHHLAKVHGCNFIVRPKREKIHGNRN